MAGGQARSRFVSTQPLTRVGPSAFLLPALSPTQRLAEEPPAPGGSPQRPALAAARRGRARQAQPEHPGHSSGGGARAVSDVTFT